MTKRKRGTDIITPPAVETFPEGHRNDYRPIVINYTHQRVLWIVSGKVIKPGQIEFHWVLTDHEGKTLETFTGTKENLPAKFKQVSNS